MTTPVPTRFSRSELAAIDRLVAEGAGDNRSDVIRRALAHFIDITTRAAVGEAIAASYRAVPQSRADDDLAMANALALTEAEPW